jgi:hypothetical protein
MSKREDEVELVWEAPRAARMPSMYDKALAEVKKRPGQWARLRVFDNTGGAYSASGGLRKRFDGDGRWEVAVRPLANGAEGFGLYVRYRTPEQLRETTTQ